MRDEFPRTREGHLCVGGCDALELARTFGTPLHVLDGGRLRASLRAYREAFARHAPGGQPVFASKALCVLATCQLAHREGFWVDVASGGELYTALRAGVPPAHVVFHGNYKTEDELRYALEAGVGRVAVDNFFELDLLDRLARQSGRVVDVWLRVTPGIEPHTHRAIQTGGVDTKFGFAIPGGAALRATREALERPGLRLRGFHSHIGSQILELDPFRLNAELVVAFAAQVRSQLGYVAEEVNLGGGLGIRYLSSDRPPSIEAYVAAVAEALRSACRAADYPAPRLFLEPGRSVVGPAGVTLYTVGPVKEIDGVRTYVA
ncbi:MAG: diaminopimelate decarboxylase, partial [Armatimonadota bacterium]|nr:diaminopimelate decarboxylase [Armatimonadota bacterium]